MSVAVEEQKRHKDSRQQDPRKERAIRGSEERIWSKRFYSPDMVFPEQSKPRYCPVLRA